MNTKLHLNIVLIVAITTITQLLSLSIFAATKKSSVSSPALNTANLNAGTSTNAKAQAEIDAIPKTQKQSSTDAQFSGILTLKDPRPEIITRDWKYFLGFKMQSLQPQGSVNNNVVGSFDLSRNASSVHPSVELGFSKPLPSDDLFINWGVIGQTGFSSEAVKLTFPSGFSAPQDTHLNTLSSSLGAKVELAIPRYSALYFNTSTRLGKISYTQTSLNDMAQFSEAATFWSWGIGTSYNFYQNWQVTADYASRKISQKSNLKIQAENAELGLRVIW